MALRFDPAWPAPAPLLFIAATSIASGLLGQAVALASILAFRRKLPAERRLPVTFSQLFGLVRCEHSLHSDPRALGDQNANLVPVAIADHGYLEAHLGVHTEVGLSGSAHA